MKVLKFTKIAFIESSFCVHVESISLIGGSLESVFAVSEGIKLMEVAFIESAFCVRRIYILDARIVGIRVCCG